VIDRKRGREISGGNNHLHLGNKRINAQSTPPAKDQLIADPKFTVTFVRPNLNEHIDRLLSSRDSAPALNLDALKSQYIEVYKDSTMNYINRRDMQRYQEAGMTPKGLQVDIQNRYLVDLPELSERWKLIVDTCSIQLMELSLQIHEVRQQKLDSQITIILEQLREAMSLDNLKIFQDKVEEDLSEQSTSVIHRKNKSLKRMRESSLETQKKATGKNEKTDEKSNKLAEKMAPKNHFLGQKRARQNTSPLYNLYADDQQTSSLTSTSAASTSRDDSRQIQARRQSPQDDQYRRRAPPNNRRDRANRDQSRPRQNQRQNQWQQSNQRRQNQNRPARQRQNSKDKTMEAILRLLQKRQ
jgi:hypothetical protein